MGVTELADAIVTDVPTEDVVTLTSPESPRMKAMAAIEESRRQALETELDGKIEADETPIANAPEPEPEIEAAPEIIPEPAKFRVKVDGVEMDVDQEELIRTYQKNAAADHRLEEATRILREAQVAAQTAVIQQPEPAIPEQDTNLRQEAAVVLAKMYDGDQDAAAEALVNLLNKKGGDRPTQPVQAVDEGQLTQRVLEQIAINQAFDKVKTDYPEILSSPRLENIAVMEIDQRVANGELRSQAMLAVCDEIYKEFGKGRPQPEEKPLSKREQNKARLDTVPTASAAAVAPKSEIQDASSVIAQMAARRLGQTMPKPTD